MFQSLVSAARPSVTTHAMPPIMLKQTMCRQTGGVRQKTMRHNTNTRQGNHTASSESSSDSSSPPLDSSSPSTSRTCTCDSLSTCSLLREATAAAENRGPATNNFVSCVKCCDMASSAASCSCTSTSLPYSVKAKHIKHVLQCMRSTSATTACVSSLQWLRLREVRCCAAARPPIGRCAILPTPRGMASSRSERSLGSAPIACSTGR